MTPQALLDHQDHGHLWDRPLTDQAGFGLDDAYASALAVRALRMARGEQPRGFKIGFTNRTIWDRYNVHAPIWGSVWNTTLSLCEQEGQLSLAATCQPRLEPETVFGMRSCPAPGASLQTLFEAIEWVAPGFEIVQSHLPDWKFLPADTVADGALHARLLVGRRIPVDQVASDAAELDALLARATVTLSRDGQRIDHGAGAHVLDSPLRALHHFLPALRACPGAPDVQAGDVVTTGTWTDAWPVAPGERWTACFSAPLGTLTATFSD
ncbi:hydratase [Hydrogenophaga sp.]|uniref:2-keto-4-pentenoate hydratase n=1 Tax=Hydrogenophaga sp. TaxID=1904254 RepID=UPI0026201D8F|nr:hydratase [Hydrogenophaga sp.]MCW5654443.1 hydratase [Hydrogenophaga sp.]